MSDRRATIVGVGSIPLSGGRAPAESTVLGIQAQAAKQALEDCGLSLGDVDAVFTSGGWGVPGTGMMPALAVAEYLRISPRLVDSTCIGGASFEAHVAHAAMALQSGACEVALITYGSLQRSLRSRRFGGRQGELAAQYEVPFGLLSPVGSYALAATRYLHEYSAGPETLAHVAVAARQWAALNPGAMKRDPLKIDDVLASPLVSDPLRQLDCCLVTDGAGAVVLTTADRAAHCRRRPVLVAGCSSATNGQVISQIPDLTDSPARRAASSVLEQSGLSVGDIDVFELYDSFTITVLLTLEAVGLCGQGEAGELVASGAISPGGAYPTNTSGGGLADLHPGMFGIFLLIEAVRQLRGEGQERQVQGAKTALVVGTGGTLSAASACTLVAPA